MENGVTGVTALDALCGAALRAISIEYSAAGVLVALRSADILECFYSQACELKRSFCPSSAVLRRSAEDLQ